MPGKHTAKQKRQAKHIAASERARGMSQDEAESVGWATVNKRKANKALEILSLDEAHKLVKGKPVYAKRNPFTKALPLKLEHSVRRRVFKFEKDPATGLFVQPRDTDAAYEEEEAKRRLAFANHFKYADKYTGNTRTVDEKGDYNCGRCNQEEDQSCLLVKIKKVDRKAGSCGDWENQCAGDPETDLRIKDPKAAAYGIAKNGKGFGCHRCPYASKAYTPDSRNRTLYCGKGVFRVYWNACCAINGAKTIPIGDDGMPKGK